MSTITFIYYKNAYQNQLAQLYYNAVTELALPFYNSAQIDMWANYPMQNSAAFSKLLLQGNVLIAIDGNNKAVGFGQLHPNNYLSLLYISPQHSRQGIGTAIYEQLEEIAINSHQSMISVTASKLSKPLFEQLGFELIDTEIALRNNIEFERYNMVKLLH